MQNLPPEQFLRRVFGSYLLPDVAKLLEQRADPNGAGACLYPLAMSLISGIELAGALRSGGRRYDRGKNKDYFAAYWARMYGDSRSAGDPLRWR